MCVFVESGREVHSKATHARRVWGLLGGPRDLVTTYNWNYSPAYHWGNPYKPI